MAAEPKKQYKRDRLLEIEEQAQKKWDARGAFETDASDDQSKETFFVTFPYPYMNGRLHLGHAFSLTKAEFSARYARLQGKRVLFPMAYHCTGMPISAAAQKLSKELNPEPEEEAAAEAAAEDTTERELAKLGQFKGRKTKAAAKSGGMGQGDILRQMEIAEEEIPKFTDPYYWLEYFPPLAGLDLRRFGLAADWRRSFITTDKNPFYDAFIRWQFNKLRAKYLAFGKRETIYSTLSQQPCMDHDRSKGEGVNPQEYTLIKLRVLDEGKGAALLAKLPAAMRQRKVFAVCATLRPETMYGQTNIFVKPDGEYGVYEMHNDELFICAERSALNMVYQEMGPMDVDPKTKIGAPRCHAHVTGLELVGCPLKPALTKYEKIYALPMLTISMTKGTGLVTSVPADAPDDWACLRDFQTKEKLRDEFGVQKEWTEFEVIPIIEIPDSPYGTASAVYMVDKLKIQSHKDADKLKEAKKETYLKGFYEGVLLVGPHKGSKVQDAKLKVKQDMLASGDACRYFEPDGYVESREGDECVVAMVDQWYLKYGDEAWTERVRAHVNSPAFNGFNAGTQNGIAGTVDWLQSWACSRSFGLGTRLPWDPAVLIESLSDSTIYMAYYTIAHLLQGGQLDGASAVKGKGPGPYGIVPEQLTDEVFDYIFTLRDDFPQTKIPHAALREMRKEFAYWYPMNLRVSGKDLIGNHLTMCLFNHAAVWEQKPELMPRGFYCNGHVMVDNEKMSKSKGNFLTLKQAINTFGADCTRIACADAGDGLEDANFSRETANQAILRLNAYDAWCKETLAAPALRTGALNFFDKAFLNELSFYVDGCKSGFERMVFRDALRFGFFELEICRSQYQVLTDNSVHKDVVLKFIEVQAIIMAPIMPHFCEHLWSEVLKRPGSVCDAAWPSTAAFDGTLHRTLQTLQADLKLIRAQKEGDIKRVAKAEKKKPEEVKFTACHIIVAKAYKPFQVECLKFLQTLPLDASGYKLQEANPMGQLKSAEFLKALDKVDVKKAMQFASFAVADVATRGASAFELELPFSEIDMLREQAELLKAQLQVDTLTFGTNEEKHERDTMDRTALALPGKPQALFW